MQNMQGTRIRRRRWKRKRGRRRRKFGHVPLFSRNVETSGGRSGERHIKNDHVASKEIVIFFSSNHDFSFLQRFILFCFDF